MRPVVRIAAAVLTVAVVLVVAWGSCGHATTPPEPRPRSDAGAARDAPPPRQAPRAQGTAAETASELSTEAATAAATPRAPGDPAPGVEVIVFDATGAPAPLAKVAFTDASGDTVRGPVATTDAEGRATLGPFRTGEFRVRAVLGDLIALGAVRYEGGGTETLRLAEGVVLRGRVTGPRGAPIAEASPSVVTSALDAFPLIVRAQTGADGRFRIGPIPAWALDDGADVRVFVDGFTPVRRHVDADAARRDEITIELTPVRRVRGRCLTETGAPVEKVVARVLGGWDWKHTDAEGRFELRFDAAEEVTVVGQPEEHAVFRITAPVSAEGVADVGDIVLRPGGTVSGRAVDEAGGPLASASVSLFTESLGEVRSVGTDEDGHFEFSAVGDGPHVLLAENFTLDDVPRHGRIAAVRAGDTGVRVVLSPGRAIRIRLVSSEDGLALVVAQFTLRIRASSDRAEVISTSTYGGSRSALYARVPRAGIYDVALAVPGRRPATVRGVVVTDDEIATADVVLSKP